MVKVTVVQARGPAAASSLIDLEKAYEHVTHPFLWRMGVKHMFNLRLLRFVIVLFGGPRVVMSNGIATGTIHAVMSSVVGGCAHATAGLVYTSPSPRAP